MFMPTHAPTRRAMPWAATSHPCGYFVQRDLHHGLFDSKAVAVGLPLLHDQSGRTCLMTFSSVLDKSSNVSTHGESPLVRKVHLIRWIDIGAGIPLP
jgi:hypothetical protein